MKRISSFALLFLAGINSARAAWNSVDQFDEEIPPPAGVSDFVVSC